MRRLAVQSRDDVYASLRDYQELHNAQGVAFSPVRAGDHQLRFTAQASARTNTAYVGAAAYLWPSEPVQIKLTLNADGQEIDGIRDLGSQRWNRLGVAVEAQNAAQITVDVSWCGHAHISMWGLSAGPLELPPALVAAGVGVTELNQTHLAPETFYLVQDVAIGMDLAEDQSSRITETPGQEITLKKCSYCGRMLPIDPERLGVLAFHKHNAKKTKHQNECRACKKWRINDDFNPRRTVDQLHESSVITRERRLFLREPEILQEIKERTGAGLKSQVWNRFGRKCFYCAKTIELEEVQLDHTRPLAYLWPIDEYATCLCAEHNNQKTDRFPAEFYSEAQLQELANITGLSLAALTVKQVNPVELERIRGDIVTFSREWEPRTFAATARKVIEMLPQVDLFRDLHEADPVLFDEVSAALAERPLSVQSKE